MPRHGELGGEGRCGGLVGRRLGGAGLLQVRGGLRARSRPRHRLSQGRGDSVKIELKIESKINKSTVYS